MRSTIVTWLGATFLMAAGCGAAVAEPGFCGQLRAELAALADNAPRQNLRCADYPLFQRPAGCPGLLGRIFGSSDGGLFDGSGRRKFELQQAMARSGCDAGTSGGGTVRTLCVRTCDGYYFPISTSASRKKLMIDEQVCRAMYPAGDAALYTQRADSDIVSLAGKPYASEPFAFRYRQTFDPACAAELKRPEASPAAAMRQSEPAEPSAAGLSAAIESSDLPRPSRIVGPATFYLAPDPNQPEDRAVVRLGMLPAGTPRVVSVPPGGSTQFPSSTAAPVQPGSRISAMAMPPSPATE